MVIILLNNYLVWHPIICWAALNFANASLYLKSFRLTTNSVFFFHFQISASISFTNAHKS